MNKPYSYYIPWDYKLAENKKRWDSFTIHEMLTHTAGITRDILATPYASQEQYNPITYSVISKMVDNRNIFIDNSDNKGRYSNFAYFLLAHLIEEISGQEYHDYLKTNIFSPLQMNSSGHFHRMFSIKNLASGYHFLDDETGDKLFKRCCLDSSSFTGSHSLYSNTKDLFIWLNELTTKEPIVLSKKSQKKMKTPHVKMKYLTQNYGYGLFIDQKGPYQRLWHDGWDYGYISLISTIPEIGLEIVILGNRHNGDVNFGDYYTQKMNDQITDLFISNSKKK